jgi:molybdopterin-synthase adenylyltransferase
MNDQDLLRYSRHILLDEIGIEGQTALAKASVLVVGAGGLGAAALMYLASAGIGKIVVADGDTVDLTNLQRQIIHRESRIGVNKALSATQSMRDVNSVNEFIAVQTRLDDESLGAHVAAADVVLDCTDNFATRRAISRAVVRHKKILISGAAIRFDGQLASFDLRYAETPCYACLFPEDASVEEERCAVMGVFAPLTGIIGTMQAAEALRAIVGIGEWARGHARSRGKLRMLNAIDMQWRDVKFQKDSACAVCGHTGDMHSTAMPEEARQQTSLEASHA